MLHNGEIPISNIDLMHQVARNQDLKHGEDSTRFNALTMQDALSITIRRNAEITAAHSRRNEKALDEVAAIVNGSSEPRRSLMEIDVTKPKIGQMSQEEIANLRKEKRRAGVSGRIRW